MENEIAILNADDLRSRIYMLRGEQVMMDFDLAQIYGYEVRVLNQQVKRNINRFPEDFMFQLTKDEIEILKSQFVTSRLENLSLKSQFATSSWGGVRKRPYAFTRNGIAMLSSVLRSETAVDVNIRIMPYDEHRVLLPNGLHHRLDKAYVFPPHTSGWQLLLLCLICNLQIR